jgi:succinate dehydrogenase/fumarate reductase flavoprotein subunit
MISEKSFYTIDPEVRQRVAETEENLPSWLEEMGLTVSWVTQYPQITYGWVAEGGSGLFAALKEQVNQRGVNVLYETPGKDLIQDPVSREILGVKAQSTDKTLNIKARKGVVLTTGGYEANLEMLNELNFPGVYMSTVGSPANTGDGLKMAMKAGARLWNLGMDVEWWYFGYRLPSELYETEITSRFPSDSYVFVNKDGTRFMDEKTMLVHRKVPLEVLDFAGNFAIPSLPNEEYDNIPFFAVFDDKVMKSGPIYTLANTGWNDIHKIYEWSADNSVELQNGWILKADTIDELATKMTAVDEFRRTVTVDSAGLADTIRQFNQDCAAGADSEFGRSNETLIPLDTPPYYAIELCVGVVYTTGGLRYNADAEVLDYDNKPIPRLYMAGMIGSYGIVLPGGVPEAFTFGRIGAQNATALEPWE